MGVKMDDFSVFSKGQRKEALQNVWVRCGIVVVAVGIFSLLIWLRNWPVPLHSISLTLLSIIGYSAFQSKEFHKFLTDTMLGIIQDNRYLKNLNREKLNNMLDSLHKIYYDLPQEMEANNLYQFIKDNILERYLGEAYIEGFETTWEFHNYPDKGYYTITYINNFRILASKDKETRGTCPIELSVSPVPEMDMKEHFPLDQWSLEIMKGESGNWEEIDLTGTDIRDHRFLYNLEFSVTKGSSFKVRSKRVAHEQLLARIAHQTFRLPTHGIKMTIILHNFENIRFDCKFNGIPPSEPRELPVSDTQYVVEFAGWMIPGNSITINF